MSGKEKTRQQLSAYLDGELSEAEAGQVRQAVAADAGLARELAELDATRKLLRTMPRERAGDDFASRVLARAERSSLMGTAEGQHAPGPLRWVRYLATAAVLLIAASVGMIIAVTLWSPPTYEDNAAYRTPERRSVAAAPKRGGAAGTVVNDVANFKKDGTALAAVAARNNEVIFTDQLDITQRQVEQVLLANGIEPATTRLHSRIPRKSGRALSRVNVYHANQLSPRTVQYEVFVTPEQMTKVQKELGVLRLRQNVPQDLAMAVAKESRGRFGRPREAEEKAHKAAETSAAGRPTVTVLKKLQEDAGSGAAKPHHGPHDADRTLAKTPATAEQGKAAKQLAVGEPSGPTTALAQGKIAAGTPAPGRKPEAPGLAESQDKSKGGEGPAGAKRLVAAVTPKAKPRPAPRSKTQPVTPAGDLADRSEKVRAMVVAAQRSLTTEGDDVKATDTTAPKRRGKPVTAPVRPTEGMDEHRRARVEAEQKAGEAARQEEVQAVRRRAPETPRRASQPAVAQGQTSGRAATTGRLKWSWQQFRQLAESLRLAVASQPAKPPTTAPATQDRERLTRLARLSPSASEADLGNALLRARQLQQVRDELAASQQATARLERLLITLNFRAATGARSPGAMFEARTKPAFQKRAATDKTATQK